MKYIYLPGNSSLNRGELEAFSEMFKEKGFDFYAHEYAHWSDESLEFDLEKELANIVPHVKPEEDYVVIGKSIGTYTAVELIAKLGRAPKKVILLGIPTGIGEDKTKRYGEVLNNLDSEILVIQNDKDPFGAMDEVRKIFSSVRYEQVVMNADTHIYMYAKEVGERL